VYEAIAKFQKALKIAPDFPEALNNEVPLFNLGKLAEDEHHEVEVKRYWMAYLQLDSSSPWAEAIRHRLSLDQPMAQAPRYRRLRHGTRARSAGWLGQR
jgi:hypothetical protein